MISRMQDLIRSVWIRTRLRGTAFADRYAQLESAYRAEDPWSMSSPREQFRFSATSRICRDWIGPRLPNLLEIGSGEGHQTLHWLDLSDEVYGLELSDRAIQRARTRCPMAKFAQNQDGRINLAPGWPTRFRLVALCEVAYYSSDPEGLIESAERLGESCVISYFEPRSGRLDPIMARIPLVGQETIEFEQTRWVVAWWNSRYLGQVSTERT